MILTRAAYTIEEDVLQHLKPYAQSEYGLANGMAQISKMKGALMWRAELVDGTPLASFGVYRPAQCGTYFFWLLLCEGFQAKHLREALAGLKEILRPYKTLQTMVAENYLIGRRFAEFAGFNPTELVVPVADIPHRIYEARF